MQGRFALEHTKSRSIHSMGWLNTFMGLTPISAEYKMTLQHKETRQVNRN